MTSKKELALLDELENEIFYLSVYAMKKYRSTRGRHLAAFAKNKKLVAYAQGQIAKLPPDTDNEAMFLLAVEGSKASVDVLTRAVTKLLKDPTNLDWLAYDLAPLLTRPATKSLRKAILDRTAKRSAASRGLQAGEALGLTGAESFRFKIAIYAKWSKIRLWFDSTKDPWYGAIWNWNERVALPRGRKATALAELEAVFKHARTGKDVVGALQGTKWERYELTTPHRGPFKKTLEAWVAKQLAGIRRS